MRLTSASNVIAAVPAINLRRVIIMTQLDCCHHSLATNQGPAAGSSGEVTIFDSIGCTPRYSDISKSHMADNQEPIDSSINRIIHRPYAAVSHRTAPKFRKVR